METCKFKIYMKEQKHARFQVFSLFSASSPPTHHNGKKPIAEPFFAWRDFDILGNMERNFVAALITVAFQFSIV